MRYRRRANHQVIVEAAQWDGSLEGVVSIANQMDPEGELEMLDAYGCVDRQMEIRHKEDSVTSADKLVVMAGGWVVNNGAGFFCVIPNEEFEAEYEPCPE